MTDDDQAEVSLEIDAGLCVGVGLCEAIAAAVFRVGDDGVAVVIGTGRLPLAQARQVVEACPSSAISITA